MQTAHNSLQGHAKCPFTLSCWSVIDIDVLLVLSYGGTNVRTNNGMIIDMNSLWGRYFSSWYLSTDLHHSHIFISLPSPCHT